MYFKAAWLVHILINIYFFAYINISFYIVLFIYSYKETNLLVVGASSSYEAP